MTQVVQDKKPERETFAVWEGHIEDLRKKVTRIRNKCKKFGCDFEYDEIGEEIREVLSNEVNPVTGKRIPVKCKFILVQAEGKAVINGWEFVADVEHTKAGNIFNKALTDVEIPERYRNSPCTCEHCKTNRIRKNTCIVRNTETGEFKQVGNACLLDFTYGMSASVATFYASIRTIFKDAEDEKIPFGSIGYRQKYYDTKEVLQYTAETIRHFGYSKSENVGDSTRNRMQDFFNLSHGNTRYWQKDEIARVKNLMEKVNFNANSLEAIKMTEDALAWLDTQGENNDYMHNLKVATALKETKSDRFGLLVSLFPTWNRELEREAQRKAEADAGKISKHVGNVGDRIEISVDKVKCITSWESCFNGNYVTTYVWQITDVDGNIYKWKTANWLNEDLPPVKIKGTVKEHKEFREIKQTELTRCKVTEKRKS